MARAILYSIFGCVVGILGMIQWITHNTNELSDDLVAGKFILPSQCPAYLQDAVLHSTMGSPVDVASTSTST